MQYDFKCEKCGNVTRGAIRPRLCQKCGTGRRHLHKIEKEPPVAK